MVLNSDFSSHLFQLTTKRCFLVAYSGGVDSHVLLHYMSQLKQYFPEYVLRAVHIHHHLSPHADAWALHCQQVCDALGIELIVRHIDVKVHMQKGDSVEAVARKYRYQTFSELLKEKECLLTAHHQDDQAETMLLQLFRGAGLPGLSAMPATKAFASSEHVRPLLSTTREAILTYAHENKLQWIEDESNQNTKYSRNYIRHQLLPEIAAHWPGVLKTLCRSAEHCAQANDLLVDIAKEDVEAIKRKNNALSVTSLLLLSKAREVNALRYWLTQSGFNLPSQKKLQEIVYHVIRCRQDAMPVVEWPGAQVRRYQDLLYVMPPLQDHDISQIIHWDITKSLVLNGVTLTITDIIENPSSGNYTIRYRHGGERLYLPNKACSVSLKNYFQEQQVPPWLRDRIPLVYCDEQLVGILLELLGF